MNEVQIPFCLILRFFGWNLMLVVMKKISLTKNQKNLYSQLCMTHVNVQAVISTCVFWVNVLVKGYPWLFLCITYVSTVGRLPTFVFQVTWTDLSIFFWFFWMTPNIFGSPISSNTSPPQQLIRSFLWDLCEVHLNMSRPNKAGLPFCIA